MSEEKVYNKDIIIIVTWSGMQYHISWSEGMTSSTQHDTVFQIKLLLL